MKNQHDKPISVHIPDKVCHCGEWSWVDCPFCKSSRYRLYYYVSYSWVMLSVVECEDCGHVFTNPVPTPEALRRYYTTDYFSSPIRGYPPSIEASLKQPGPWSWRHDEFNYQLDILGKIAPIKGKLLEIGPGWGGMLYWALQKGVDEVHALDISHSVLEYVSGNLNCQTYCGFLSEVELPPESFDIIIANQVIEHSLQPKEDMIKCHNLLKENGRLLLVTPNLDSFLSQQQRAYWRAIRGGNHYQHFTPDFISNRLREAGFVIQHLSTTSRFYHWPEELKFELSMQANDQPLDKILRELEKDMRGEDITVVATKQQSAKD